MHLSVFWNSSRQSWNEYCNLARKVNAEHGGKWMMYQIANGAQMVFDNVDAAAAYSILRLIPNGKHVSSLVLQRHDPLPAGMTMTATVDCPFHFISLSHIIMQQKFCFE